MSAAVKGVQQDGTAVDGVRVIGGGPGTTWPRDPGDVYDTPNPTSEGSAIYWMHEAAYWPVGAQEVTVHLAFSGRMFDPGFPAGWTPPAEASSIVLTADVTIWFTVLLTEPLPRTSSAFIPGRPRFTPPR